MAAVSRVLPWRRAAARGDQILAPVIESYRKHWPRKSPATITRAFELAQQAHDGARRQTGEAYINHPVAVANVVADIGLDETSICAALLHDAVEDTPLQLVDLRDQFDSETAAIVDGVTKLDRVSFASKQAQHAATLRKMLVAMAKDGRVLIIKLADRLHNMRTLGVFDAHKQARVAQETLDIYAPLANRLGMGEVRNELEDLAFAALYPKRYAEIDRLIAARSPAQEAYVDEVIEAVGDRLRTAKISAQVSGREKHHWSVYEKMAIKGRSFEEIFDLVGIRLIVSDIHDAYAAVGTIHSMWKPVPGRFKDYIAMPKSNLYQSLHTTVVGPQGSALEVQIRTAEMHHQAEYGLAAHWRYKSGDEGDQPGGWLAHAIDLGEEATDPSVFMETLVADLGTGEVYVFTPRGDVMTLPTGSTPIDFAYAVHTDIGDRLIGAKVNGRLVPLDRVLASGDTVEAFTSADESARPPQAWLEVVASPRARAGIRRMSLRSEREEMVAAGREQLEEALRDEGLHPGLVLGSDQMEALAAEFNRNDAEVLYEAVGKGDVAAKAVVKRILAGLEGPERGPSLPARPPGRRDSRRRRTAAVYAPDHADALLALADCCKPVAGDEIMGFVSHRGDISVHRADCAGAVEVAVAGGARQAEVEWEEGSADDTLVVIEVFGLDRNRLLLDVVTVLSNNHLSIERADTFTGEDQVAVLRFEVVLGDRAILHQLLTALRAVPSVFDARPSDEDDAVL